METDRDRDRLLAALPTLLRELAETGVVELEVTVGSASLYLRQRPGAIALPTGHGLPANGAALAEPAEAGLVPVTTPLSGVFYTTPSPDDPPYATKGDAVEAGQVVALVEAMKVFNEIHAEVSGVVEDILVSAGQSVRAGQTLMTIRPDTSSAPAARPDTG